MHEQRPWASWKVSYFQLHIIYFGDRRSQILILGTTSSTLLRTQQSCWKAPCLRPLLNRHRDVECRQTNSNMGLHHISIVQFNVASLSGGVIKICCAACSFTWPSATTLVARRHLWLVSEGKLLDSFPSTKKPRWGERYWNPVDTWQ